MLAQMKAIKHYREKLYSHFRQRKDAIMNLLDAISSMAHRCRSVVELSEAPCFERQYTSITDAIADGLPHADWDQIEFTPIQLLYEPNAQYAPCFLLDCTPNPRPFAHKLADRTITHAPNPAPGNKPICVGHQYSCIALSTEDRLAHHRKWVIPISMRRVKSHEKGNERGMQQLSEHINAFGFLEKNVVSVGDSLYGSEYCRMEAGKHPYLVHIFRLNSKRNLYQFPKNNPNDRGRKKIYGNKFSLFDFETLPKPDDYVQTGRLTHTGKIHRVKIETWNDLLIRGSKRYDARQYPLRVCRIRMFDETGTPLFKRPLWIAVQGAYRNSLTPICAYQYYMTRYHIEHFFRFSKNNLLLDAFQTHDVEHEESWWRLCVLAYNQLYLAKSIVCDMVKAWEKYLPKDKFNPHKKSMMETPSRTQRGFGALLKEIGSPAKHCVKRGVESGRKKGTKGPVLKNQPIIFKQTNNQNHIIQGCDLRPSSSNPRKIKALIKTVRTKLIELNCSTSEFTTLLWNTS